MASDRYCRCIIHVSPQYPEYNPYAVCKSSIYKGKSVGNPSCRDKMQFDLFDTRELRGYAKMKKIPGAISMSRRELIDTLYEHESRGESSSAGQSKGSRSSWQREVKRVMNERGVTLPEASKIASRERRGGSV